MTKLASQQIKEVLKKYEDPQADPEMRVLVESAREVLTHRAVMERLETITTELEKFCPASIGQVIATELRTLMQTTACAVCGLSEPVADTALCLHCQEIRKHKFTDCTILIVDGSWSTEHPTIGGAGLVLVNESPTGEITGQRYCGFRCHGSHNAEYEAVLRAHRWAPKALIYSDLKPLVRSLQGRRSRPGPLAGQIRYLEPHLRGNAYQRAHRLALQGRRTLINREMPPQIVTRLRVGAAAGHPRCSRADRRQMAVELLLERVRYDPNFKGDFSTVVAELGWTSGPRWQDNPIIWIAKQHWLAQQGR